MASSSSRLQFSSSTTSILEVKTELPVLSHEKLSPIDIHEDSGTFVSKQELDFVEKYVEKNGESLKGKKIKKGTVLQLDGKECKLTRSLLITEEKRPFVVYKSKDHKFSNEKELIEALRSQGEPFEFKSGVVCNIDHGDKFSLQHSYSFKNGNLTVFWNANPNAKFSYTGAYLLGAGNYGRVKLAYDMKEKKLVVVKIIQISKISNEKSFFNECANEKVLGRSLGGLSNKTNNKSYLFLPLAKGKTFRQYFAERSYLILSYVIDTMIEIATELKKLHAKGIIHCDLHDENVLFDGQKATIIDLGASILTHSEKLFYSHPFYPRCNINQKEYYQKYPSHAPEGMQVSGKGFCFKSDVYSLGYLLGRLLDKCGDENEKIFAALQNLEQQMDDYEWESRPSLDEVIQCLEILKKNLEEIVQPKNSTQSISSALNLSLSSIVVNPVPSTSKEQDNNKATEKNNPQNVSEEKPLKICLHV